MYFSFFATQDDTATSECQMEVKMEVREKGVLNYHFPKNKVVGLKHCAVANYFHTRNNR